MSTPNDVINEAKALEAEYKAGRLSAAELKEMLEDLKHTKAISVAAGDLATRGAIVELIDGIIAGAGAL